MIKTWGPDEGFVVLTSRVLFTGRAPFLGGAPLVRRIPFSWRTPSRWCPAGWTPSCVVVYFSLNNGVGRLCLRRVEDCHECGWTSGSPCIGVNRETCGGSDVTGMVASATIVAVAVAVAVAILSISFACVCSRVVGS